jgi:hypothetical protein
MRMHRECRANRGKWTASDHSPSTGASNARVQRTRETAMLGAELAED